MFTDPTTGAQRNGIMKVRYSHEAMIDVLLSNPEIRQNELAAMFDRTPAWISTIINSDAFQARLAERRGEEVDPVVAASIQNRLSTVAALSLEKMVEKLSGPITPTDDFLLQTAKLATGALGYGAKAPSANQTNIAVVVQVPAKIANSADWANTYKVG